MTIWRGALVVAFVLAAGAALPRTAMAQTLDQQVVALTENHCAALGIPLSEFLSPDLGPNLGIICRNDPPPDRPPGFVPPAVGGGAAAGAGSDKGLSGEAAVERRKKKRREENGDDQAAPNQVTSPTQSGRSEETFLGERLALFVSVDYDGRDKAVTPFAAGHESDRWGVTAGADYRLTPAFVAGLAVNGNRLDGEFSSLGKFRTSSLGAIAYGAYSTESGYFADFSLDAAYKEIEAVRHISGVYNSVVLINERTASDTEGYELSSRLNLGKDFSAGRFTFGPRAGLNYLFTHIERMEEEGSSGLRLIYRQRRLDSLQSALGVQASAAFSTGFGVLMPQLSAEWVHEFMADQHSIDVRFAEDLRTNPTWFSFQTDKPDRDFFNLRGGMVIAMPGGVQGFIEIRTILGHDYFDGAGGAAGLRFAL